MATLRLVPASGEPIEVSKDPSLVGREPSCDVVVSDGSVSRKHARLERRGELWAVVDQASANGTYLDSARVADAGLRNGQELRFGAVSFRVEIEGAAEEGATVMQPPRSPTLPTMLTPRIELPPPAPSLRAPAPPVSPPPPRPAAEPPRPPPLPGRALTLPSRPPRPASPVGPLEAPATARAGRGPLFYMGLGCCGCLLLVVLGLGAFAGFLYWSTSGPASVVQAQMQEVREGRMDAAYERLADAYQARLPRADFEALVDRHPGFKDNADATFWRRSITGDNARFSGVLTPRGGSPEPVAIEFVRQGGDWKIASLRFESEDPAPEARPPGATPPRAPAAERRAGEARTDLAIETQEVQKQPSGSGVVVTIKIRVRGFATRPEAGGFRIDLAQDLETLGPDGRRIEGLTQKDFKRLTNTAAVAEGLYADFVTTLTLEQAGAGTYLVRLTIRDLVSGGQASHEVPFGLP